MATAEHTISTSNFQGLRDHEILYPKISDKKSNTCVWTPATLLLSTAATWKAGTSCDFVAIAPHAFLHIFVLATYAFACVLFEDFCELTSAVQNSSSLLDFSAVSPIGVTSPLPSAFSLFLVTLFSHNGRSRTS
jgi:hypothetical protein